MAMSNSDLIDDMLEGDGPFAQWLERERSIFLGYHRRDATLEGFREHVRKLAEANPKVMEMFITGFVDAFIENDPDLKDG